MTCTPVAIHITEKIYKSRDSIVEAKFELRLRELESYIISEAKTMHEFK